VDDDIQIALFDYSIVPDPLNQFFLSDQMPATSNQQSQSCKRLGGQRHDLIASQESVLRRVEAERSEFVSLLNVRNHKGCKKFLRLIRATLMLLQNFPKDFVWGVGLLLCHCLGFCKIAGAI
jgi:hypothetical protein